MLYEEEVLPLTDLTSSINDFAVNEIPLKCKRNFVLSDIWLPSHVLPNRKIKQDSHLERPLYHTLKAESVNRSQSFSTYSDSDSETEEIFSSDDEEFLLSFENREEIACDNSAQKSIVETKTETSSYSKLNPISNLSELNESFEDAAKYSTNSSTCSLQDLEYVCSDSTEKSSPEQISNSTLNTFQKSSCEFTDLNLDKEPEISFKIINKKFHIGEESYATSKEAGCSKYGMKKEKSQSKKAQKSMPLESFLQSNDYLEGFESEKPEKDEFYENCITSKYQPCLYNKVSDFPSLSNPCSSFELKNSARETENPKLSIKSIAKCLNEQSIADETYNNENVAQEVYETDRNNVHIIIENIPEGVTEKDINDIVMGYGEVKKLSLQTVGNFLTAELELDLDSIDLDWILECLNGSQPFGASSEMLKCYKKESSRH